MILRGIDFGRVFNSSGARNFDGQGWWYHKYAKPFGLDYEGSTFVAKTTTLHARPGNMKLGEDAMTPTSLFPDCIRVNWLQGHALNAVGLSGPGAQWLLDNGVWMGQTKPFFISFMSVADNRTARLSELSQFVQLLRTYPIATVPFGLQINFSCPNVGLDPTKIADEMSDSLDIAEALGVPIVPKINATFPHSAVFKIQNHRSLDAICVSNTIPWGQLPDLINWPALFGTTTSPLAQYGGGGLSGRPLLDIVARWISDLRYSYTKKSRQFNKPVVAGGGILSKEDVEIMLIGVGADAIELGSVSMLRPWRVQGIIEHANSLGKTPRSKL